MKYSPQNSGADDSVCQLICPLIHNQVASHVFLSYYRVYTPADFNITLRRVHSTSTKPRITQERRILTNQLLYEYRGVGHPAFAPVQSHSMTVLWHGKHMKASVIQYIYKERL